MGLVLSLTLGQVLISHAYDKNGNILTVTGTDPVTYTYDSRNRLTSETHGGVTTSYEYDSRGNLVKETQGSNITKYTYAGDNRLTQVEQNGIITTYEYDLNGNLIGDSKGSVYGYDEENKLVYANVNGVVAEYDIGTDGLRKWKLIGGQSTDYTTNQNGFVIMEGGDEIVRGHQALAKKTADGYYYYIYNAHGDVVMMVDESGNVKNTYAYDAWGKITEETETVPNSIKYAGEYTDAETGFVYLRNRCYDPTTRRFTSEDPVRDELNWYVYCGNNPVMMVDPSGLKPGDKFSTLAAAVRDADDYYMDVTIKTDEEMVGLIYQDSDGKYYYITATNLASDKTRGFSVKWSKEPIALFHTHVYYDVNHINDNFSTPGNSTGPNGASDTNFADTQGITIFVGTPNGKIKMYKPNSKLPKTFNGEGKVDPKTEVYEKIKDSKLWDFVDKNYPTINKMDIVKAKLKHPNDTAKVLSTLGITVTPAQIKEIEQ